MEEELNLASNISKKSEIPRGSIYDTLKRLEEEGLISYIIRDNKKYFLPVEPKTILEEVEYKRDRIAQIIPKLEELKNNHNKEPSTSVEVMTGTKAIQKILNLLLDQENVWVFGASGKSSEVIPLFKENWFRERKKRKIPFKVLYNDTEETRKHLLNNKLLNKTNGWDYRFLSVNHLTSMITILSTNKVILINWSKENPLAIIINSAEMFNNYKEYFSVLWKTSLV